MSRLILSTDTTSIGAEEHKARRYDYSWEAALNLAALTL
jgi:hypothetical protein